MKVLVTGGAGNVGRWVVQELVGRGHAVTVGGRKLDRKIDDARYVSLEMTDLSDVVLKTRGFERVIHLAALPGPIQGEDHRVFDINCRGTFHLYEACALNGIPKIAVASSLCFLGQHFGIKPIAVKYFPIDEGHPGFATDAYSFSKQVSESIALYAWNRYAISSVQLRIPRVVEPTERNAEAFRATRREGRLLESASDFWCLIDSRDSARAFALGIEAPYEGSYPLFVNDRANCLGLPTRELAARYYPEVRDWRAPLEGDESLIACGKAMEVIGWEPAFSWKGVAGGGPLPGIR